MNAQKVYIPTLLTLALLVLAFAVTLPAFADNGHSRSDKKHATASSTMKMKKDKMATSTEKMRKDKSATSTRKVDLTCMQTAVDAREDSLGTAYSSFNGLVETALGVRKTGLHDAWGLTDAKARMTAVKTARETFRKSHESALKDLKKSRQSAWEKFKTTAKSSCKETLPKGDDAVEKDAAGAITI